MRAQAEAFDSFLFPSEGPLPFTRHCITQDNDLPFHPRTSPLHPHPNSPPQAPLKLPPYAPQTIAPFSLPALRAGLGNVYTLTRLQRRTVRAPSRESGTPSAPDTYEGTIVLSVRVGFMETQQEGEDIDQNSTVILGRSTIRKYASGQGDMVGEFVRVLLKGDGSALARGPVARWFGDMSSPR